MVPIRRPDPRTKPRRFPTPNAKHQPGAPDRVALSQRWMSPMQLTLLKCKLHRACVTHAELDYEGSCAIDEDLMRLAGIREYEQLHIYNITNGERFTTYAIRAEAGSRVISVNGAAAHKAQPKDRIIICCYAGMSEQEATRFAPTLVYCDEHNAVLGTSNRIPAQAA
jgi:aspartate 1-decarboxylase